MSDEARLTRRPLERDRVLVEDFAAEASHPPLGVLLRRDAALGETRAEVRVERVDRPEDALAHQLPERRATDGGERLREHDVAEVAVGERAEVLRQRLLRRAPERLLPGLRLLPQWEPPLEAGGVCQHVPERDVVLPTAAEIGDELAEGSLERDDPVFDERQDQSGSGELRQRREVEERIHGARSVRTSARIGAQ